MNTHLLPLAKQRFVCIDCEATGLNPQEDRIVEVAVATFSLDTIDEQLESLVNPGGLIRPESILIHNITDEMVANQPSIDVLLPQILLLIGNLPIVGHNIKFDIDLLAAEAARCAIGTTIQSNPSLDTLRLARLYGNSPSNSLEVLRQHFNIPAEGAHRAMSDVIVNIQVFKRLCKNYNRTQDLFDVLSRPISMKNMPLGKHKGRPLKEIPLQYLLWAANQDFDQDLLYSLRSEINRRKKGHSFTCHTSPFSVL